ncbi:V-set and immunoglobulin domain-containing protein 1-like [Protopterus annectens]|uniref:V-set and immunoglobulin domain-containing protein 1-like n=1 Tax=Protopterus annectens TaxID=7888 RepID=UPI001CFC0A27|nr:V-set and immunoglobulin domain-containing protein 1-like [Protopterus annectens]
MWTNLLKTIILIGSLAGGVISMQVTCPEKMVNGTVGQSITLYCNYETSLPIADGLVIRWSFYTRQVPRPKLFYTYQMGNWFPSEVPEGKYEGTTAATAKNASIIIRNAETEDTGMYTCEVTNVPDVSGTISANVFAYIRGKPTKTTCIKQVENHEDYHWVFLSCSSKAMPPPTYEWQWKSSGGSYHDVEGEMNNRTGILNITNPMNMKTGIYRCTARNEMGEDVCDYEEKEDKETSSSSTASSTAIIIGVVIAIILLLVVTGVTVWFVLYKKKEEGKSTKTTAKSKSAGSYKAVAADSNYSTVASQEAFPSTINTTEVEVSEESAAYNKKTATPPPTERTSIELQV